jgi:hypothetical protein
MISEQFKPIADLDLEPIKVKLMHAESGEGWSLAQADAVEFEYRRFLYLMKMFPHEQTAPLMDVDTFWHYHILDTMKYAVDCEAVFGYFLHHFPYIGLRGEDDTEAHHRVGNRMKELYEATFGEAYVRDAAPAYSGAATAENAYSGAVSATAYSGAATTRTAYSGAATAGQVAYSGAATAKTVYSGAATIVAYSGAATAKTAYSGAATAVAYSGAATAKTAYSGAATAKTAYSGAATAAATAYSGAATAQTAYSGAATATQTAYSGAASVPASASADSFYAQRPRLTAR